MLNYHIDYKNVVFDYFHKPKRLKFEATIP